MHERAERWHALSGHRIDVHVVDLAQREACDRLVRDVRPDTLVHYAEQPSAPYSMMGPAAADLTLHNNLGATLNMVLAVRAHVPECHIVKLGTMGEYGTPACDIPEG